MLNALALFQQALLQPLPLDLIKVLELHQRALGISLDLFDSQSALVPLGFQLQLIPAQLLLELALTLQQGLVAAQLCSP